MGNSKLIERGVIYSKHQNNYEKDCQIEDTKQINKLEKYIAV